MRVTTNLRKKTYVDVDQNGEILPLRSKSSVDVERMGLKKPGVIKVYLNPDIQHKSTEPEKIFTVKVMKPKNK